jgi:CheY-like chemotaxis protein
MSRVIVGEDDRMTSHLLCSILRKGGYEAVPAFDFALTLAMAGQAPLPVAILLDMHMPGGTGLDTLRALKDPSKPEAKVPVIAMSGTSDAEHNAETLPALGASAFLLKPVEPDAVMEALRVALATG